MIFLGVVLLVILMSSLSILVLTPIAGRIGLVDVPNHRKLHNGHIPLIGGISVYVGLAIGVMLFATPGSGFITYMLCSSLLVVLGVMDDSWDISPLARLIVQGIVALIMCGAGIYISHLGDLFGLGEIYLGPGGVVLTVVAVVAGINAFNMIDGVDGLLGGVSMITLLTLALLFFLGGDQNGMRLALIMAVALVPYLLANLGLVPAGVRKIFMGDTGSMLIGFTVVWLLVKGSQGENPSFSAATALWLIAFPLMDMVRVMVGRKRAGKRLFEADRTHLHHLLLVRYANPHTVLVKICTLSVFFATVGVVMEISELHESIIFLMFIAGFVTYMAHINKVGTKILV